MSENEMLCKTCRRWADGWCLAQQMGMSSNKVCNAWELSPVVDWVSEKGALNARIAELKVFIDQLIEAGNALDVPPDDFSEEQKDWREIVRDWKEG